MRVYPVVNAVQQNRSQNDRSSNVSFGLFGIKPKLDPEQAEQVGFSNLEHYIRNLSSKETDKLGDDAIRAKDTDGFWREICKKIGFSFD